ncbi:non-specific lipid-transfer protein-like isoform X1 [Punica granatum]|uniref:Non-specific lipid-transfer protein-like isoform X1 n=1 Tax=Punica granatum TaxID=22663 RepID=A0A6P8BPZ4_PUNGR|nr:non-specific lipid-transfer protein-like isoform X1 [Punica granatum]
MAITRRNELVTDLALAVVLAALLLFHGASAQSGCTSSLLGLTPCLSYVSGNSSTPSSTCCSRLAGIVQSQPQCLCLLFNGRASSSSYNINQTLALALPGACNVQTPPVSRCSCTIYAHNVPIEPSYKFSRRRHTGHYYSDYIISARHSPRNRVEDSSDHGYREHIRCEHKSEAVPLLHCLRPSIRSVSLGHFQILRFKK